VLSTGQPIVDQGQPVYVDAAGNRVGSLPAGAAVTPGAAAALPTATTVPGLTLAVGANIEVFNTGQCLNVREKPGLGGLAVDCLPDGTRLRITGGPSEADGAVWWEVTRQSVASKGWVSSEYVRPERR